jgi:hypothetical protein
MSLESQLASRGQPTRECLQYNAPTSEQPLARSVRCEHLTNNNEAADFRRCIYHETKGRRKTKSTRSAEHREQVCRACERTCGFGIQAHENAETKPKYDPIALSVSTVLAIEMCQRAHDSQWD